MTLYLALDTATALGSVALGDAGGVVAEVTMGNRRHAAATVPAVEEVLRLGGVELGDLAGLVIADGPGSFTGLRIGFATAKGIWQARSDLTLYQAPSLMAAAWRAAAFTQGPIAAIYDALRGEVFAAVYEFLDGAVRVLLPPVLVRPETLVESAPRPALALGDGAALHAALMRDWTGRPPIGPPDGMPRASALLALLGVRGAVTRIENPAAAEPSYGRLAEAQARWERAHGRPLPHPPGGAG